MATLVTAGTEILRAHHFELPTGTGVGPHSLIQGEQHHIYTVLSIICHCSYDAIANANEGLTVGITGYDHIGGDSAQSMFIFVHKDAEIKGRDTFVWNDKFSFNGYEPSSNTQAAIAAQGGSVSQKLFATKGHANDSWHITVTFIDQNNE